MFSIKYNSELLKNHQREALESKENLQLGFEPLQFRERFFKASLFGPLRSRLRYQVITINKAKNPLVTVSKSSISSLFPFFFQTRDILCQKLEMYIQQVFQSKS